MAGLKKNRLSDTRWQAYEMTLQGVTRLYEKMLAAGAALLPLFAIGYLATYSALSEICIENHPFHEGAIGVSILLSGFVTYVSWRSYRESGEVFLRWVTAGFLVLTLIYAPHGFLTRTAQSNVWLFILYGPVSRLAMMVCLMFGLLQYGKPPEDPAAVSRSGFWQRLAWLCAAVDVIVAVVAYSPVASSPWLRLSMEAAAGVLCVGGIGMLAIRRADSPLMKTFAVALAFFAQAALAFSLARPWNQMWWLAHGIFAGGFFVLSWGASRALLTTRSFHSARSQEHMLDALESNQSKLKQSIAQLELYAHCIARATDVIIITDAEPVDRPGPRIVYVNDAFERTTGFTREEAIGNTPRMLQGEKTDRAALDRIRTALSNWKPVREEILNYTKSGQEFWVEIEIVPVANEAGWFTHWISVQRDTTERMKTMATLAAAKQAAEAGNNAKSIFLATMSHELRTPMNGVLGMIEVLKMTDLDEEQHGYVDIVARSGTSLMAILNDVLDFSQIEAGKLELAPAACDPKAVAGECAALFSELAGSKHIRLEVSSAGLGESSYLVDAIRLRQMVSNLVSNAIKFTSAGFVRISVAEIERDNGLALLEIAVIDTGIGIPQDKQDRLFQAFSQVDGSVTRQYEGTGLGLAIVHHLARLMGGGAGVQSNEGQGSRFWFRIRVEVLREDDESRETRRG